MAVRKRDVQTRIEYANPLPQVITDLMTMCQGRDYSIHIASHIQQEKIGRISGPYICIISDKAFHLDGLPISHCPHMANTRTHPLGRHGA